MTYPYVNMGYLIGEYEPNIVIRQLSQIRLHLKIDGLVKSRKMAFFLNSRLIITVGYKAAFGKF
jgi:hypothetical protein